jgi:hypothetical protein
VTPQPAPQHGIVDAALEAFAAAIPLDLCAHLDDSPAGAQLYMRVPALVHLDASAAYRLFADLRTALEKAGVAPDDPHAVEVEGITAIAVATGTGPERRVTVAGRRESVLTPDEVDALTTLARALAVLDPASGAEHGPLRVSVEASGGISRAEVTLGIAGTESTGVAEAAMTAEAVARAALDAAGAAVLFEGVGETVVANERAVVVVVRRGDGRAATGAALAGGDPLQATAAATLAAVASAEQ